MNKPSAASSVIKRRQRRFTESSTSEDHSQSLASQARLRRGRMQPRQRQASVDLDNFPDFHPDGPPPSSATKARFYKRSHSEFPHDTIPDDGGGLGVGSDGASSAGSHRKAPSSGTVQNAIIGCAYNFIINKHGVTKKLRLGNV